MRVLNGDKFVVFNGKTFHLHSRTGKVLDTTTRAETEVHGSGGGGGGFTYQGAGASSTAPVRISSTTTRYTKIFMVDVDGQEHAVELVDFDVHCRVGNGLTLIWAIAEGKDRGPYIAAYNHSTRDMAYDKPVLAKLNQPTLLSMAAGAAIGLVLGLVLKFGGFTILTVLLGLWGGLIAARIIGRRRAEAFKIGPDMAAIRTQLEAIPSAKLAELTAA